LQPLQTCRKCWFDCFAKGFDLFALLGEPLEFLIAIVQLFKQRFDGFFVHAKPDALADLELVVTLPWIGDEKSLELVMRELTM
jgi:hypothetical protein